MLSQNSCPTPKTAPSPSQKSISAYAPKTTKSNNRDIVVPYLSLTIAYGSLIASLVRPPIPATNYILISPLLTPVAGLTTFFTSSSQKTILSKHSADTQSLSVQGILAIYGGGDIFAFSTKRYRRFFEHVQRDWGTKAKIVEIEGGGHFWMDLRGKETLKREVMAFISS